MGAKHGTPAERLWRRVVKRDSGCWEWTGSVVPTTGYGSINVNGKSMPTHRLAWEVTCGPVPPRLFVCHTCDNPICCNPMHLFLGTAWDNNHDAMAKGRLNVYRNIPRGERHLSCKVSNAQVQEICARRLAGETLVSIARDFGISHQQVSNIAHGQRKVL